MSRPWNGTTCAQNGWPCFALHLRALRIMRSLTFYCPRLESQPVGDNKKVNACWSWQCNLRTSMPAPSSSPSSMLTLAAAIFLHLRDHKRDVNYTIPYTCRKGCKRPWANYPSARRALNCRWSHLAAPSSQTPSAPSKESSSLDGDSA